MNCRISCTDNMLFRLIYIYIGLLLSTNEDAVSEFCIFAWSVIVGRINEER